MRSVIPTVAFLLLVWANVPAQAQEWNVKGGRILTGMHNGNPDISEWLSSDKCGARDNSSISAVSNDQYTDRNSTDSYFSFAIFCRADGTGQTWKLGSADVRSGIIDKITNGLEERTVAILGFHKGGFLQNTVLDYIYTEGHDPGQDLRKPNEQWAHFSVKDTWGAPLELLMKNVCTTSSLYDIHGAVSQPTRSGQYDIHVWCRKRDEGHGWRNMVYPVESNYQAIYRFAPPLVSYRIIGVIKGGGNKDQLVVINQ